VVAASEAPQRLQEALSYSTLAGGKRVRPLLIYLTGALFAVEAEMLDAAAVAVELIHTYSLIHDDLPAMDNDALRRGRPTCHIAFDEATAILAGDGLQALAFHHLACATRLSSEQRLAMLATLTAAAGVTGMVGGQMIDMASEGKSLTLAALTDLHRRKTGALIAASVRMGYLAATNCSETAATALDNYAAAIGIAFQIRDDILDVVGDSKDLGKHSGTDVMAQKSTYPSLLGLAGAKAQLADVLNSARHALTPFGTAAAGLLAMADYIGSRHL
ncbi:MAG: polyprenyl synthetase family protein, partial [Gammaproteobacteria bacterium]|nr:polyprenyl synthetase family protein [Gammaproteobacteria bacterium]